MRTSERIIRIEQNEGIEFAPPCAHSRRASARLDMYDSFSGGRYLCHQRNQITAQQEPGRPGN